MRIKHPHFSPVSALFVLAMDIAKLVALLVQIITLGWVGRNWPLRVMGYALEHPLNVVYDYDRDPTHNEGDDDEG